MAEAAVNVISLIFGHEQKHWTNEKSITFNHKVDMNVIHFRAIHPIVVQPFHSKQAHLKFLQKPFVVYQITVEIFQS